MTTDQIEAELGRRIEAFRLARNLRQEDVAREAGISRVTLSRLEGGKGATLESLLRVMRALDLSTRVLDLVPDARASPLDPLGERRQRARVTQNDAPASEWTWGD